MISTAQLHARVMAVRAHDSGRDRSRRLRRLAFFAAAAAVVVPSLVVAGPAEASAPAAHSTTSSRLAPAMPLR
jgi:hypothetical protein